MFNAFRLFCVLLSQRDVRCVHPVLTSPFRVWVTVWVKHCDGAEMTTL